MNDTCPGKESLSLGELCGLLKAEIKGNPEVRVRGIGSLEDAAPDQISFLADSRHLHLVASCRAAALIVDPAFRELDFNLLITENPYLALASAARMFSDSSPEKPGIHATAVVGEDARLEAGVSVGPLACLGAGCRIGRGTRIRGGAYIGAGVRIGEECLVHPRVSILDRCVLGDRVIVHSGAVIGADGFGYARDGQGRHVKIPHVGIVQIDDDVEIGANATVDRATFGKTWIKRGAKIDNLVMVAHNVVVGEDAVLVAQVGISGSTRLGDGVVIGGQVGIAGHIEIGDRVQIGAKSGVLHPIKPDSQMIGIPAVPLKDWFRMYGNIQRLPRLKEELKRLGARVKEIEEALKGDDGHCSD